MEKVRLIPAQIKYAEKKLNELENKKVSLNKKIHNEEKRGIYPNRQELESVPDFSTLYDLSDVRKELSKLKDILQNCIIVDEYNSSKIDIGTKFRATLDYGDGDVETGVFVLIEGIRIQGNDEFEYVSIESPFGKAVYNSKENDVICFPIPNNKVCGGLIEEIIPKEKKENNLTKQLS